MMIWFTADTHFGHSAIIRHCDRPWDTVGEMGRAIVDNINAFVMPNDDLYVLGDFSFHITREQAMDVRRRIRCRRVHLLPGNHDKDWSQPEVAGTFVCEPPIVTLRAGGRKLVLSHYPMEDWPAMSHGSIHLHGHIHSGGQDYNMLNRAQGIYRYDVGVDANGYCPVSLDDVLAWFDGVECHGRADWRRWVVSTDSPECEEYAATLLGMDAE